MAEATLKKTVQELNRVKDSDGGDKTIFTNVEEAAAASADCAGAGAGAGVGADAGGTGTGIFLATRFAEHALVLVKKIEKAAGEVGMTLYPPQDGKSVVSKVEDLSNEMNGLIALLQTR
jgi:hypothetical protein